MIAKILIVLVVVLVIFIIVVVFQPSRYRIFRSTAISASPADVFALINDLHRFQDWSPWARLDPNMKLTYEGAPCGVGAAYAWEGNKKVGQGRMTITESRANELVRMKLEFIKPFPSTSMAEFVLKPEGAQTAVTWSFSGDNNFMAKAFFLFVSMDKMVGGDFARGLAQLKNLTEKTKG